MPSRLRSSPACDQTARSYRAGDLIICAPRRGPYRAANPGPGYALRRICVIGEGIFSISSMIRGGHCASWSPTGKNFGMAIDRMAERVACRIVSAPRGRRERNARQPPASEGARAARPPPPCGRGLFSTACMRRCARRDRRARGPAALSPVEGSLDRRWMAAVPPPCGSRLLSTACMKTLRRAGLAWGEPPAFPTLHQIVPGARSSGRVREPMRQQVRRSMLHRVLQGVLHGEVTVETRLIFFQGSARPYPRDSCRRHRHGNGLRRYQSSRHPL